MAKYTRRVIMKSFLNLLHDKSMDKITVKEIIESAEVNRNTFYYHFQDIYDLLDQTFLEESERFYEETSAECSFCEEYVRLASFFLEHKKAIIHIYHSKSKHVINQYLESVSMHFVQQFVEQAAEGSRISEAGIEYITDFYSYAIMGATLRWIEEGMQDVHEGLIETISQSFEATVGDMIQAYVDGHPQECKQNF